MYAPTDKFENHGLSPSAERCWTRWEPLLEGSLADKAWQAIADIGQDLTALPPTHRPGDILGTGLQRDASLAGGDAGIALFWAYLARSNPTALDATAWKDDYLTRAVKAMATQTLNTSLHSGFSGIAWVVEHLYPRLSPDPLCDIDSELAGYLTKSPGRSLDVISGLAGIGIYLLERLPGNDVAAGLRGILSALATRAEHIAPGTTWRIQPEQLDATDRREYPKGRYDLGVAHGIPGIIAFLARVCAAGIDQETSRSLLSGAVRWLIAVTPEGVASPRLPRWCAPEGRMLSAKAAWCYGDLGVAAALRMAAAATRIDGLEEYSMGLARGMALSSSGANEAADGSLCHGAAGIGHLFNRLYQASKEPIFREVALSCFAEVLRGRDPGTGVGGYRILIRDANLNDVWVASPDFLSGAAGIGLALHAALTPIEPAWDRVLGISAPVAQAGVPAPDMKK